jgi:putative hydrolase of HD superfamily
MSRTENSVGDITPVEGVPAHVKHQLEEEAMDAFLNEMLGGEGNKEAKARFRSLWDVSSDPPQVLSKLTREEYEARQTPESKLVKVRSI